MSDYCISCPNSVKLVLQRFYLCRSLIPWEVQSVFVLTSLSRAPMDIGLEDRKCCQRCRQAQASFALGLALQHNTHETTYLHILKHLLCINIYTHHSSTSLGTFRRTVRETSPSCSTLSCTRRYPCFLGIQSKKTNQYIIPIRPTDHAKATWDCMPTCQ